MRVYKHWYRGIWSWGRKTDSLGHTHYSFGCFTVVI